MYTGWLQPFRTARLLTQQERRSALLQGRQEQGVTPSQRMSLIGVNSTYIDWVDRRFLFRGSFGIVCVTIVETFLALFTVKFAVFSAFEYDDYAHVITGVMTIFFFFVMICFWLKFFLLKEYFTYTHYPVRFNRKTRMVHVFRHNGEGGVLSVPWDKVFFHIGEGTARKDLIDIRGEVLEGDIVKATFALGHTVPKSRQRSLLEMWEFIRRYMEEGPEAVGPHPLDRYVGLSVMPSWKNCFLATTTYYAAGLPTFFQVLVSPFVGLFILTRWVVLHTCRKPVFPPEIEATCQVDPDDLNVWPIPRSSGEFAATVPGLLAHAEAKARRRWQAEREQRKR